MLTVALIEPQRRRDVRWHPRLERWPRWFERRLDNPSGLETSDEDRRCWCFAVPIRNPVRRPQKSKEKVLRDQAIRHSIGARVAFAADSVVDPRAAQARRHDVIAQTCEGGL